LLCHSRVVLLILDHGINCVETLVELAKRRSAVRILLSFRPKTSVDAFYPRAQKEISIPSNERQIVLPDPIQPLPAVLHFGLLFFSKYATK